MYDTPTFIPGSVKLGAEDNKLQARWSGFATRVHVPGVRLPIYQPYDWRVRAHMKKMFNRNIGTVMDRQRHYSMMNTQNFSELYRPVDSTAMTPTFQWLLTQDLKSGYRPPYVPHPNLNYELLFREKVPREELHGALMGADLTSQRNLLYPDDFAILDYAKNLARAERSLRSTADPLAPYSDLHASRRRLAKTKFSVNELDPSEPDNWSWLRDK